jgi:hypothetical protein
MKKLAIFAFTFTAFLSHSQNIEDVYRYSRTYVSGSVRFDAMGGSFGAIGAESSCIAINPAGFGRMSVSSIALGINGTSVKTTSVFNDNSSALSSFKVRLPNLAGTYVKDVSAGGSGLLYIQLSAGINRVANFNNSIQYSGQQFESLLDVFANQANGVSPDQLYNYLPYTSSLAYQAYAIDPDQQYNYYPRLNSGDMIHNRTVKKSGGINEWYFAFSGNYIGRVYFGASISINTLNYSQNITHQESLTDTTGVSLRSFTYQYDLKTKGNGTALKLGAIFVPAEFLRLGIALHTPTFYDLTDDYSANMTAIHSYGEQQVDPAFIPANRYKYRLWTPTKAVGSIGFVFQQYGCINVDLEYVNYAWGNLRSTKDQGYAAYNYKAENTEVKANLVDALNIRVGGEWVIKDMFFIRAGYGFYPKGDVLDRTYSKKFDQTISGGFGLRFNRMFIDVSMRYLAESSIYKAFYESTTYVKTNSMLFNIGLRYKFDYE